MVFTRTIPLLIVFSFGTSWAQVASLSGTWQLNVEKSKWGKLQKPVTAVVSITHREPKLEYTGSIVYATGEDTRPFGFNGAIDGKEYPGTRSAGAGKITLKRVDDRTIFSHFRSDDGLFTEEATTSVSPDGKSMRRALQRKGPDGELKWTEVYEKR
jgi:hypothetical protein